jgi:hypothetical protein
MNRALTGIRHCLILCLLAGRLFAANDADRVVVVRNTKSHVSRQIADDYTQRRGVNQVVDIECTDSMEGIDAATYRKAIETPLRTYLSSHPGIDYIVLTKGIPIRLQGVPGIRSLDSMLAALDYDHSPGAIPVHISYGWTADAWANRFWNSREPFSHAKYGGYLVTRLDGYTAADAMALTTRSLAASKALASGKSPDGLILLDCNLGHGAIDKSKQPYSIRPAGHDGKSPIAIIGESAWGNWDADMLLAADLLEARNIPCRVETNCFSGGLNGLMGYASWGSNDSRFNATAYHSLGFAPGAIVETAVSTSGRSFLPTKGGQSMIADLIVQGVAGAKGYVSEPLLQAIASPSIMFDRYTRGWTLADSLYAASALIGWQDIVIGDPLCRAYPARQPSRSAAAQRN